MYLEDKEAFRATTKPDLWKGVLDADAGVTIDYTNGGVAFRDRGSADGAHRSYLRTTEADSHDHSWVVVVTVTVTSTAPSSAAGMPFFGLGVGEPSPDRWNEPRGKPHVYCRAKPTGFAGAHLDVTNNGHYPAAEKAGVAGDGTHSLWLIWDPGSGKAGHAVKIFGRDVKRMGKAMAVFAISPSASPGERRLTETTFLEPVDCSGNGFVSGNARLFIGGAGE